MNIELKIVNKESSYVRDTTVGKVYPAVYRKRGEVGPNGKLAKQNSFTFKDDVNDWVDILVTNKSYTLV